jgi:CBS domain-containing protein
MTTVSELMTKKVSFVRAHDSLSVAAKMMWDGDCGVVPVLEAGGERVVGMITDRDICMATFMRDRPPSGIAVAEVMSRGLFSCTPEDSIEAAESLMRDKQIRRLPVLDASGALAGILSLADLVKRTRPTNGGGKKKQPQAPLLTPEQVTQTLANICQPPVEAPKPAKRSKPSSLEAVD